MDTNQHFHYHEIDFEQVAVATTAIKKIALKNPTKLHVHYAITRSPHTSPIYQPFDLNKYSALLRPQEERHVKVTYKPQVPWAKDCDYFTITGSTQLQQICMRGESTAPVINASTNYLQFTKSGKKVFELINNSDIAAPFHFDRDDHNAGVFQVRPLRGTIEAKKVVQIAVDFCAKSPAGVYSYELVCLIVHHEPIVIFLLGVNDASQNYGKLTIRRFSIAYEDYVGFKGFLRDSIIYSKSVPPISISNIFLDFGRGGNNCQTLTTSLTNHTENQVEVAWDLDDAFKVIPHKICIPGQVSVLFECRFTPTDNSYMWHRILTGQVVWTDELTAEDRFCAPIPITLRLIAGCFPEDQTWIPSVTVQPQTIIMPQTLPNYPSWSTFTLQSNSHLPILFKFLPPKKTNYVIKPMVGLITSLQIVVVQLHHNCSTPSSYIETWNIELNGQLNKLIPIYLKGQTVLPKLVVGIDNRVEFDPTQPGSTTFIYVPIQNQSPCQAQFKIEACDQLEIADTCGIIKSNEEIFTCWAFKPNTEGTTELTVKVVAQAILNRDVVTGKPIEITIPAVPRFCNWGPIIPGTKRHTSFYLFNFGESPVYFELYGTYKNSDEEVPDLVFTPKTAKCGPKEKVYVQLYAYCRGHQKHKITVFYRCRTSEYSHELSNNKSIEIFQVKYTGISYGVKIDTIIEHNFGHIFSKSDLWQILNVDKLNSILSETHSSQFDLNVPECQMDSRLYYVTFLIKNTGKFDTPLVLKRRKICDCQYKEATTGLSVREKVLECPHKEAACLKLADDHISAKSMLPLVLTIKYCLANKTTLLYVLRVGDKATIDININVNSITSPFLSLFDADPQLNLGDVYIGLREPPVQAYWIYNSTSTPIMYMVDDLDVVKLCNSNNFEVLKCLNLTAWVKPFTSFAILWRFCPIEVTTYAISVPIKLGTQLINLRIEGRGSSQCQQYNYEFDNSATYKSDRPVYLSADHLEMQPFLVHSSAERMIFITNRSTSAHYQFNWKICYIDGLLQVDVRNSEGILKPDESHPLILTVRSLSEPTVIKVCIYCTLVNKSQLLMHEESVEAHNQRQKQIDEEYTHDDGSTDIVIPVAFTYLAFYQIPVFTARSNQTEIGYVPENSIEIVAPPQPFTLSLSLNVTIVSSVDKDLLLPVDYQFKSTMFSCVDIKAKPVDNHYDNNKNCLSVLECLATDAVFSCYFRELMWDLKRQPNPQYSQIQKGHKGAEDAPKDETSCTQIGDIMKEAAIESVGRTFRL